MTAHYSKAPIAEAVIDLHVAFDGPPNFADLELFGKALKQAYPHQHRINALQFELQAKDDSGGRVAVSSDSKSAPIGIRMSTDRNDRVVQLRLNGLSYSHLPPYTDWTQFKAEARQIWDSVVASFRPINVTRTAIRYINRIVVPQGCDLDQYLNLTPRLLAAPNNLVEGYFLQLVLPQRDIDAECRAVINTGLEGLSGSDSMNVLFDVDIFVAHAPPGISVDRAWEVLDQLRDRKNQIFESAITDHVREMIK